MNLSEAFRTALGNFGLSLNNIIEISMDGPNVNHRFWTDMKNMLKDELSPDNPEMVDTGTCTLHSVHGSYKTAHVKS